MKWKCTGGAACIRIVYSWCSITTGTLHTNEYLCSWVSKVVSLLGYWDYMYSNLMSPWYFGIAYIYLPQTVFWTYNTMYILQVNIHKRLESWWMHCWEFGCAELIWYSFIRFPVNIFCTMSKDFVSITYTFVYILPTGNSVTTIYFVFFERSFEPYKIYLLHSISTQSISATLCSINCLIYFRKFALKTFVPRQLRWIAKCL